MKNAVLIYNPKSGRQGARRVLPRVLEALRAAGFEVEPTPTTAAGDATRLAREAAAEGSIEVAFAMGGDGTLREAASGLLGSEVALGALPAGTTNVLAQVLGLPQDALGAARATARCRRRQLDVGLAGDEPFLMQVSAGLDAEVMAHQDSEAKKRFGKAAVAWTGLAQWWSYDYPQLELGGRSERVSYFAACNIPFYAGAFRMAPDADPGDGRLDLVTFRGTGRVATLGFARDLALGRHLERPDVDARRVEGLELVGPPGRYRVQIDGDVLTGPMPLEISMSEQRLWVMASI